MLMDLDSNCMQTKHFRAQIESGKAVKKQIWKQIVERKIQNQSQLLCKLSLGADMRYCVRRLRVPLWMRGCCQR